MTHLEIPCINPVWLTMQRRPGAEHPPVHLGQSSVDKDEDEDLDEWGRAPGTASAGPLFQRVTVDEL